MTCAACAQRIETRINRLPGAKGSVNFAIESARVELDPTQTSPAQLVEAIQAIGYDVRPQAVQLALEGMTCAACAQRIEKALNQVPGVSASVNFATEQARIELLPGITSLAGAIAAVRAAGYDAHELVEATREEERERRATQYRNERNRFVAAAILAAPFLLQMAGMLFGQHDLLPRWLQFALATPIQFWIGKRFYVGAWHAIRTSGPLGFSLRNANMDVLVALGTSMAYLFSAAVVLLDLQQQHVYFEASASIITLVLLGKLLESRAKARASRAIEALVKLQPNVAHVERAGAHQDIATEQLARGDVFQVRAGERVPADGEVLEGTSSVDESLLTGESSPVAKAQGAKIYAATVNQNGMLRVRATQVGAGTALAHIIRLVAEAQGSKAPVQRLADKVAGIFVPVVMAIAAVTFVSWWWWSSELSQALVNAVAVLVIACPCALGLATPTAIMVGIGRAAQAGILIKNAAALELAGKLSTLVLDKTGTLTEGKPRVVQAQPCADAHPSSKFSLQEVAGALARTSTHPLSQAIATWAGGTAMAQDARSIPGGGVSGELRSSSGTLTRAHLGSPQFIASYIGAQVLREADALRAGGKTVVGVASGTDLLGWLAIEDQLRASTPSAIAALKGMRVRPLMLTGDHEQAAARVAAQAGISDYRANVKPEDKAEAVKTLRAAGALAQQRAPQRGACVGMVGDGINDAPALAAADVSFAIGAGADVAIESADITLARDDLLGVVDAIDLSRATLRKIYQNLFFAFFYNALGIPLAALGMLNPVVAGAAMALSSVSVVSNALLLRRWRNRL